MIYLRMREKTTSLAGRALKLTDVADVLADAALQLDNLPIEVPRLPGVWKLDAMPLVRAIQERCPKETVVLMGSAYGTLICEEERKQPRGSFWRATLACAVLFIGSAMAIAWFHADVNMMAAQHEVARLVTGSEATSTWWIALPYALGVGSGVAFYYALVGRKTVSPLDIKLGEYRRQAREVLLRDARDAVEADSHGQPRG